MAKSSSAMKRSGAYFGNIQAEQNSETQIVRTRYINRAEERQRFMETQNPSEFTETPPDTISLNGITFTNISRGSRKSLDSNNKRQYISEYQASEANQNGEYPVFRVVVTDTKKKRGYRYVFNQSSVSGTIFY